jgi:hypothetical protein
MSELNTVQEQLNLLETQILLQQMSKTSQK